MPQISLYVDETTLQKIEHAAHQENVSISKWVSSKLKEHIEPGFSKDFQNLFGSITDDNFIKPKEAGFLADSYRELL